MIFSNFISGRGKISVSRTNLKLELKLTKVDADGQATILQPNSCHLNYQLGYLHGLFLQITRMEKTVAETAHTKLFLFLCSKTVAAAASEFCMYYYYSPNSPAACTDATEIFHRQLEDKKKDEHLFSSVQFCCKSGRFLYLCLIS